MISITCRTSARSALADRGAATRAAGVLVALALLGGGCQAEEPYVAPTPTASADVVAPAAAATTLDSLRRALRRSDRDAAAALGADLGSADRLAALAGNVDALELTDISFRYITDDGPIAPDGSWNAAVEVTWRYAGFDRAVARAEIDVAFADSGTAVAGIAGGDRLAPLWLDGAVTSRHSDGTLVAASGGGRILGEVARQAEQALVVVRRVLGGRADGLVVEVPRSPTALHRALGAEPGTYDAVAAVTTSADGALTPGSAVHVFLNPDVYGGLDPVSAQVVMSHEAVHAVTDAPLAQGVELWLLEGFADYVALRDVDLPIGRTAGQIIDQVKADGVPAELPSRLDFDTQGQHLGTAYEAAWLVCRTLAEHGGEEALVAFYDAVIDGAALEAELRRRFDWTLADLTRAWQDRLAAIAAGSSGG